jgi:L-fucose isomerase-like protein
MHMPIRKGNIALVPIASPLHDRGSVARVVSAYRAWLAETFDVESPCLTNPEEVGRTGLRDTSGILALIVTGGTEQVLGATAALRRPLLVLAHESMNSVPAALEALSSISGPRTKMLLGKGRKQLAEVKRFTEAARILARISRHRIGLIGGPSPWLTYSLPDADALASRLGIEIVEISMEEFRDKYSSISAPTITTLARGPVKMAQVLSSASEPDLRKSIGIYAALRTLVEKYNLTSISPRCFDFIKDFGATGCLALSRLNDEGTVAGCEGDIPSTVGMITLAEVSGNPAFMGNPSSIDGHKLVLAHCTVATKLTERIRQLSHFESGIGVALAGQFRKGARVTVARFGSSYRLLRAGEGAIVRGDPWSRDLCRTQVEIRMDGNADVFWKRPTGNHLVMTYGNHVHSLENLASIMGIDFEKV